MANNNGRINFNVDFNVNRQQINQLKADFQALRNINIADFSNLNRNLTLSQAQQELKTLKQRS